MYTVGKLAKKYGLSRSTLLYYDSIGLLSPVSHAKGKYRLYSSDDEIRLKHICHYRHCGLSLKEIANVLDNQDTEVADILNQRLNSLSEEIDLLRNQQKIILDLLGSPNISNTEKVDTDSWALLFRDAGITKREMLHWHSEFKRISPDEYDVFLNKLHLPKDETKLIRSWTSAPQKLLRLNETTNQFMSSYFRVYEGLYRKGPGDFASTHYAYHLCRELPEYPKILDIGCGSAINTIDLAKISDAEVIAVDIYEPYLKEGQIHVEKGKLTEKITLQKADMANLDFEPETFDLIWSEGAAYIMKFSEALGYWKTFLKPDGYLVVSEAVWLKSSPPKELRDFWDESYPEMQDTQGNINLIQQAGFKPVGNFVIPQQDWDQFYNHLSIHLNRIAPMSENDSNYKTIFENIRREIDLYYQYKSWYGYEFYIMQNC